MQTLSKIILHIVFSTKNREPIIISEIETKLFHFIQTEIKKEKCFAIEINGIADHIHILLQLNPTVSISEIVKRIKGASSHYINENNFIPQKFVWQSGFACFSVSESNVDKVKNYILNQKEHHKKQSFEKKINWFQTFI